MTVDLQVYDLVFYFLGNMTCGQNKQIKKEVLSQINLFSHITRVYSSVSPLPRAFVKNYLWVIESLSKDFKMLT